MSRRIASSLIVACCLLAICAGGVVAAEATADRSVPPEAAPGDTVTVTTTIERDSGGPVDYADEFDPGFEDATIVSITLDGERFLPMLSEARNDSLFVITNALEAGTVEVVFEVTVPDDAEPGDTVAFDGDFRVEPGTDPIPVTGDTVLTIVEPVDEVDPGGSDDADAENGGAGSDDGEGGSNMADSVDDEERPAVGEGEDGEADSEETDDEAVVAGQDAVDDEDGLGLPLVGSILAVVIAALTLCWRST